MKTKLTLLMILLSFSVLANDPFTMEMQIADRIKGSIPATEICFLDYDAGLVGYFKVCGVVVNPTAELNGLKIRSEDVPLLFFVQDTCRIHFRHIRPPMPTTRKVCMKMFMDFVAKERER